MVYLHTAYLEDSKDIVPRTYNRCYDNTDTIFHLYSIKKKKILVYN